MIGTINTIELIPVGSIQYIEAYANYSKVFHGENHMLLSNESLLKLENKFDSLFFRIHHSYLINLKRVKRYYRSGEVELENGKVLPVARRRRTDFINSLQQWVEGEIRVS